MTKENLIQLIVEEVLKELQYYTLPESSVSASASSTTTASSVNNKTSSQNNQNSNAQTVSFDKKLLSEEKAAKIISSNAGTLKVRKSTIITPSALDLLNSNKVKIIKW